MSNKYIQNYLIFIAILLIASCAARHSEPIAGKIDLSTPELKNGERQYMMYCQKCHPQGEGGLGPAISSNPAPGFVKAFQVRHGLGVMPSFKKGEIARQDLKDIKAYLHALKTN